MRLWDAVETSDSTEGAGDGGACGTGAADGGFFLVMGAGRDLMGVFAGASSSEGTSKMSRSDGFDGGGLVVTLLVGTLTVLFTVF